MAIKIWRGITPAISQRSTLTVGGTVSGGESFTVTVGNASHVIVAAAAGTAVTAEQIHSVLTSAVVPNQFRDVTWSVSGSVITAIANVSGVPVTISTAATGSATFVTATPTAATGPNFANVAGNWSGGTLPIAGDDLIIPAESPSILYGLTTLTALFDSVTVETGFGRSGQRIGLLNINQAGYLEYRDRYWSINTSKLVIGDSGSTVTTQQQIKIDLKATATVVEVNRTGRKQGVEDPVELIGGSNATLAIDNGIVSLSRIAGEASDYASIIVGRSGVLQMGAACIADDVVNRGSVIAFNVLPDLTCESGTVSANNQITAVDILGGTVTYTSDQTITTATIGPGSLVCRSQKPVTITSLTARKGAMFQDVNENATITTLAMSGAAKFST